MGFQIKSLFGLSLDPVAKAYLPCLYVVAVAIKLTENFDDRIYIYDTSNLIVVHGVR